MGWSNGKEPVVCIGHPLLAEQEKYPGYSDGGLTGNAKGLGRPWWFVRNGVKPPGYSGDARSNTMSSTINIPVVVQPDAEAFVAQLGRQVELDQMIEHVRQTVPGLRSIEVQRRSSYDLGDQDRVVIQVTMDDPQTFEDPTQEELGGWKVDTFPPEVCEHFCFLTVYGSSHAG